MPKSVDILFITLASPIQIGVYEDGTLIEKVQSYEKSSDVLPKIFDEISSKYDVKKLLYTNGPGSFMAIKITYIFLKSIPKFINSFLIFSTSLGFPPKPCTTT